MFGEDCRCRLGETKTSNDHSIWVISCRHYDRWSRDIRWSFGRLRRVCLNWRLVLTRIFLSRSSFPWRFRSGIRDWSTGFPLFGLRPNKWDRRVRKLKRVLFSRIRTRNLPRDSDHWWKGRHHWVARSGGRILQNLYIDNTGGLWLWSKAARTMVAQIRKGGTSLGFLLFLVGKPGVRSPEWLRVFRFEACCVFFSKKFGSKWAFGCERGTFPHIRRAGLGGEGDESEETEITSTESSWLSLSSFYYKRSER